MFTVLVLFIVLNVIICGEDIVGDQQLIISRGVRISRDGPECPYGPGRLEVPECPDRSECPKRPECLEMGQNVQR